MINIIIAILISLTFALPCYAQQDFRVKEVKGKEVIIEDKKAGKDWKVKEGEDIGDGWKVVEVTDDIVTIEKEIGPHEKIRGQMSVGGGKKIEAR